MVKAAWCVPIFAGFRSICGWKLAGAALVMLSAQLSAAERAWIPEDSNSRITVENAIVDGAETTVFFLTWPYLGDPNSGRPCPLNYYSVKLRPGLAEMPVNTIAKGVCSGLFQKSRLLDNGEALLIVGDGLEHWRNGERIDSRTFSAVDPFRELGVTSATHGGQLYDISPAGDIVMAVQSGGATGQQGATELVIASLETDGERRWEVRIPAGGDYIAPEQVWAGADGGALVQVNRGFDGTQLQAITVDGNSVPVQLSAGEVDPADLVTMTPEEAQRFMSQQPKPESIRRIAVQARQVGGFDVLFHRTGGGPSREGHFLYRLGPQGGLQAEIPLGSGISDHGLAEWHDFYVGDGELILLSRASVTQKVVNRIRRTWAQNIVSRVDLKTGVPESRLLPLDERYLEAALSAGDEGMQYLDDHPGSDPVLLTRLGEQPFVVSIGWLSQRQALRMQEVDRSLPAYTEAIDKKRAPQAREVARGAQVSAATAGQAVDTHDFNAQIAAAMAQARQQMADDPNITPAMRTQMEAMFAQMGQAPGLPSAAADAVPEDKALQVNSNQQGVVEFEHRDGRPVTLLIYDRATGEELLNQEYKDGFIYELVDFSTFDRPLAQIGVMYRDVSGQVLADLTPVIAR